MEALDGHLIGYDDNTSPTEAFLWANQLKSRPRDIQFNHVYSRIADPECYTNLANLCISPSFLAKLTDTDAEIQKLLRYRSFDPYGSNPEAENAPDKPGTYGDLIWADPLPACCDVPQVLRRQVQSRDNRTTRIIAQTGWLFGTTKD